MRKLRRQHSPDLLDVCPVIGQAGYFVLTAQFSLALQPCRKNAFFQRMQERHTKGDILVALGLIIAIDALQSLIQLADEKGHIGRLLFKFNQPFMGAIAGIAKVNRCGSIVIDDRARFHTGDCDGLISIVDDHFLAESIDKMFQPAADLDPERLAGSELNGISQQVSPKSSVGIDHESVLLTQLHVTKSDGLGAWFAIFLHGHKFHKNSVVKIQQHPIVIRISLRGEEPLDVVPRIFTASEWTQVSR